MVVALREPWDHNQPLSDVFLWASPGAGGAVPARAVSVPHGAGEGAHRPGPGPHGQHDGPGRHGSVSCGPRAEGLYRLLPRRGGTGQGCDEVRGETVLGGGGGGANALKR